MPRLFVAAGLSALALAACQPEPSGEPSAAHSAASVTPATSAAPSPASTTPAPSDTCGADKVSGRWLNALPTDDVKADIAARVGDRPIRYYAQGDPITLDFSAARLNVELGADGRIKLFRCG